MPAEYATETALNEKISALSNHDLALLRERISDARPDLDELAEAIRIFKIQYGHWPSAITLI